MSYCPACGNPVPDEADVRFCARCGRDLAPSAGAGAVPPPPAAPPTVTAYVPPQPGTPPGPGAVPPPQGETIASAVPPPWPGAVPPQYAPTAVVAVPRTVPSPAAVVARRVFTGRWEWPAAVAAAPVLAVAALAVLIGAVTGHTVPHSGLGLTTRVRLALAALVQGLGGSLRVSQPLPSYDDTDNTGGTGDFGSSGSNGFDDSSGSNGFDDSSGSNGFDDSSGSSFGDGSDFTDSSTSFSTAHTGFTSGSGHTAHETVSVMPLSVTLLWIAVLWIGLRLLRKRQAGPDAAVRVTLLATVGALVLALAGQPGVHGADVSSGPFLVVLVTFLITLVTSLAVLTGPGLGVRLAAHPDAAAAYRVLRTALLALTAAVLLAGAVAFVVACCYYDDLTGWGVTLAALMVPNLGVSALSMGWGGPLSVKDSGVVGGSFHKSVGLGELSHVWHGWAVVLAVGVGLVAALLIGLLAVRRSRNRVEQFAVAGLFTALFVILVSFAGLSVDRSLGGASTGGASDGSRSSVSSSLPEALMFGLLWSVGGVLAAYALARALGWRTPPAYGPGSGGPGAGPQPAPPGAPGTVPPQAGAPAVLDLGIVQPDRLSGDDGRQPRHL